MNDDTTPIPLGDAEDDDTTRLLRRALNQEADMVQPTDKLSSITERIDDSERRPRWVPVLAAVAAVAVIGVGAALGLGLGGDDDPVTPAAPPTDSPTSEPAPPPTEPAPSETPAWTTPPPAEGDVLPVYWVGEQGSRFALFREFGEAGPADPAARVQAAVDAALGGSPADPDYSSPWADGAAATTSLGDSEIAIDLNAAAAGSSMGSELAVVAVQQLVWTATAAAVQDVPVRITVEGEAADLFGTVSTSEPISRGSGQEDPRSLVWIDLPDGASTPVAQRTVSGEGVNAYENTLNYTLERDGSVVDEGFFGVSGPPNGEPVDTGQRGTWEVDLEVSEPGEYTLTVEVPDASDGESTVRSFDSKTFTAR